MHAIPAHVAASLARQYAFRFPHGPSLADRLADLLARYPSLPRGSWISWEGASLTQCETPVKIRALYHALTGD